MKQKFYNVWMPRYCRWTNANFIGHVRSGQQDPKSPVKLSKEDAQKWANYINRFCESDEIFAEVRELSYNKIAKIIPGFPLDNTLPILQAGYIQDRQRKLFKR